MMRSQAARFGRRPQELESGTSRSLFIDGPWSWRSGDFVAGTDKIGLDDAIFTAIGGTLNANAFVIGTAAQDGDDRIIYNSATGALFYDADGSGGGAAVQFATLAGAPILTAGDFAMI